MHFYGAMDCIIIMGVYIQAIVGRLLALLFGFQLRL